MQEHSFWNYPDTDLKRGGIYRIVHIPTKREYIGQALCFLIRWQGHLQCLRGHKHPNKKLEHSWHFHGEHEFQFFILEFVDEPSYLTECEQQYLDTRDPYYNICKTAGSIRGFRWSEVSRERMRQSSLLRHKRYREQGGTLSEKQYLQIRAAIASRHEKYRGLGWTPTQRTAFERRKELPMSHRRRESYERLKRTLLPNLLPVMWKNSRAAMAAKSRKSNEQVMAVIQSWGYEQPLPLGTYQIAKRVATDSDIPLPTAYIAIRRLLRQGIITITPRTDRQLERTPRYLAYWERMRGTTLQDMTEKQQQAFKRRRGIYTPAMAEGTKKALDTIKQRVEQQLQRILTVIDIWELDRMRLPYFRKVFSHRIAEHFNYKQDTAEEYLRRLEERGDIAFLYRRERHRSASPAISISSSVAPFVPPRSPMQGILWADDSEETK